MTNPSLSSWLAADQQQQQQEDEIMNYVIPQLINKDSLRSNHTADTEAETVASDCSDDNNDNNTKERSARRIKFAETQFQYLIETWREYSQQERELCWYSQKENKKRMAKAKKIGKRIEEGKPEKKSAPYRGLERWTIQGTKDFEELQFRLYNSILDEQDYQWEHGITNVKRLARRSQKLSAACVDEAYKMAYQDEEAAIEIYSAPSKPSKKIFADDDTAHSSIGTASMASGSVASCSSKSAKKKKDKKSKTKRLGRKKSDLEKGLKKLPAMSDDDSSIGSLTSAASSVGSTPSTASSVGSLVSASAAAYVGNTSPDSPTTTTTKKKKSSKKTKRKKDRKTAPPPPPPDGFPLASPTPNLRKKSAKTTTDKSQKANNPVTNKKEPTTATNKKKSKKAKDKKQ